MTGLCGWIGALGEVPPARRILRDMAAGLPSWEGTQSRGQARAEAGLLVRGWFGRWSYHEEDGLWAGIEGCPRWTSLELADLAQDRGHGAALAAAYRRHGEGLFGRLAGAFSCAVIEPASRRALLAIDRFAVHTMYYAPWSGEGLAFGATAEAVRAHPKTSATITPQEIYNYLFFSVCPAPTTIYREQRKLLPAQYLVFEDGQVRVDFYWRMPYRADGPARIQDLASELEALLQQAVRRAIADEAPERLGAFLSGGLDSSTVAGVLGQVTGAQARTFTIAFEQDRYDESGYARSAARHFHTEHYEETLTPRQVLDLIPRLAEVYDEPFANSSAVPTFYCARMAREHGVEALLAGDGGDELFAGNGIYVQQLIFELYGRLPEGLRLGLIEPVLCGAHIGNGVRFLRRARNYVRYARIPLPDRLQVYNFWYRIERTTMFGEENLRAIDQDQPLAVRREMFEHAAPASPIQRMMHMDLTAALADNDLRKVGRMCGLAGVRVAYPFLDEDLAEFSARVPPSLLIRRLRLRDFYKRALRHFLPRETLEKQKHGFGMPFEEWFKEDQDLRACAQDNLRAFQRRMYLRPEFVAEVIRRHAGAANSPSDEIVWDIVMLEQWLRAHGYG